MQSSEHRVETATLLSLLIATLHTNIAWYVDVPVRALAILGVFSGRLRLSEWLWLAICAFMVTGVATRWYRVDNHMYLCVYWFASIYLTLKVFHDHDARVRAMAHCARGLVGVAMALAVTWKIASPDYLNGAFFEETLLLDSRFGSVVRTICGLSSADVASNDHAVSVLTEVHASVSELPLISSGRVRTVACFLTWWALGIELVLAVLFLLVPRRLSILKSGLDARNAVLVVFLMSTYSLATVSGFGWLLAVMGLAQCDSSDRVSQYLLLSSIVLITAYELPWSYFVL